MLPIWLTSPYIMQLILVSLFWCWYVWWSCCIISYMFQWINTWWYCFITYLLPIMCSMPSNIRICGGCNKQILFGNCLGVEHSYFHPDCFRCHSCHRPITEREVFQSSWDLEDIDISYNLFSSFDSLLHRHSMEMHSGILLFKFFPKSHVIFTLKPIATKASILTLLFHPFLTAFCFC